MENRVNKHVFAWVFCFLLGELGVDSSEVRLVSEF